MEPTVLFGIQFTLSLVAYTLIAFWYVVPRLSGLPREKALMPLLWIHVFRIAGGTILELGDCIHLCASVAGEQCAHFPAIAPSQSLHQEGGRKWGCVAMRIRIWESQAKERKRTLLSLFLWFCRLVRP